MIESARFKRIGRCVRECQPDLRKSSLDNAFSGSGKHLLRYIDAKYTTRFTYTTRKFQRRGPATAANVEHMLPDTGVYLTKRGDTRRP